MFSIHSLTSDLDSEKELLIGLKKREIDQKFMYINDGAKLYYKAIDSRDTEKNRKSNQDNDFSFLKSEIKKDEKIAIISLGCGNAGSELNTLEKMIEVGFEVGYYGVDFSKSMLGLAENTLKHLPIKKHFICADIGSQTFKEEIALMTQDYNKKIYAFLGGTFNNSNQTFIIDSLYNIVRSGDILRVDVPGRIGTSAISDMKIFERYMEYLKNPNNVKSDFYPLDSAGIPQENGTIKLDVSKEDYIGALLFNFYFVFNIKTKISVRDEVLHFLVGEKINILSIRVYDPEKLINFFEDHDFGFIKKNLKVIDNAIYKADFLFKK